MADSAIRREQPRAASGFDGALGESIWPLDAFRALMRNWLQAIPLLAATLIVLPPVKAFMRQQTGVTLWLLVVGLSVAVLLAAFAPLGSISKPASIYKWPQVKARLMETHEAKLKAGSRESRHMPAQRVR